MTVPVKRRPRVLALLLLPLAGCQSLAPVDASLSYVERIPSGDAVALGSAIADTVADHWPGAHTTLVLIPPNRAQTPNGFTTALTTGLLNSGFALSPPDSAPNDTTHRLQYWVTALDGEWLIRLQLDGTPMARLYAHDATGSLVAASPMTVRN